MSPPSTGLKGRRIMVVEDSFPKAQGLFWKDTKIVGHP